MRIIAEFSKGEGVRYLSHLDLQRAMQRALRRSGLPVRYSAGFNPHTVLSFASALSVGVRSRCELMDVGIEGEVAPEAFVAEMNSVLPPALRVLRARAVEESHAPPMGVVHSATYFVRFPAGGGAGQEALSRAVASFLAAPSVLVEKKSKRGRKTVDIRPMVYALEAREGGLFLHLAHREEASLKPELLLTALGVGDPPAADIERVGLWMADGREVFDDNNV